MKVYKISQSEEFADEGHDIEENVGEADNFAAQQEIDDHALGKGGLTHTSDVLTEAGKSIGERINSSYVAHGSVGWFRYQDGIIYEVQVSPAAYGKYFGYFKELRERENRPAGSSAPEAASADDNLPM